MNDKPKFIKDAIYWNQHVGKKGCWLRISDLNYVEDGDYYTPAVPAGLPVLMCRDVYPYESWMEEFIGTDKKDLKEFRTRKNLLEFLDDVWHLGNGANLEKWQKADCSDWINWVEKQGKQEQKQWKPSQEQLDALHQAIVKACSTQYGVHLQDLEIDLRRLYGQTK